jgi:hypothetical protein
VNVGWGVSVAVGVLVEVSVGVEVGARREAEEGRKVLNKHENITARSRNNRTILQRSQRMFTIS